jgi:hypothetical protein
MESGSVVHYSSKFRAPQFAAQDRFARSSGESRTFSMTALGIPGFHFSIRPVHGLALKIRHLALKSRRLASAASPRRDFFCSFIDRPTVSFFAPLFSAVRRLGSSGVSNEQGNSLRCDHVHRLQAVRAGLRL